MCPMFIQLILDYLLLDTPKPMHTDEFDEKGNETEYVEPFHVKFIKQSAMKAILKPSSRSTYQYKGKQHGEKFGQFEKTETCIEDTEIEEDGDDDDPGDDYDAQDKGDDEEEEEQDEAVDEPVGDTKTEPEVDVVTEGRSKKKHDKSKSKTGEYSMKPAAGKDTEEEEPERPIKRLKKVKDSKKSPPSKVPHLKVRFPSISEMMSDQATQTTTIPPNIGFPTTLAKTLQSYIQKLKLRQKTI